MRHEWGTKSVYFHERIRPGGVIWVVITGGPRHPDEWRLLQKIVVEQLYLEYDDAYKYRAKGDPNGSRVFDPEMQSNLELVLKQLDFAGAKSIRATGRAVGQTLQVLRRLSERDGWLLSQYADELTPYGS